MSVCGHVQDGDADGPAAGCRSTASAELLEFTNKYLDVDDGPKHLDDQRKRVIRSASVYAKIDFAYTERTSQGICTLWTQLNVYLLELQNRF